MSVFTFKPKSFLSGYIDYIWCSNEVHLDVMETTCPMMYSELIFHYGEHFKVTGEHVTATKHIDTDIILSGLKTRPFVTEVSGRYSAVGFLLKPHCYGIIKHLIGYDKLVPVSGSLRRFLLDRSYPDFDSAEKLLQNLFKHRHPWYFLNVFQHQVNPSHLRRGAIGKALHSINTSRKHFNICFKRFVGITPGEFIKLKQIHHAIDLMRSNGNLSLTDVSYEAGFYDQAHFSRTFKSYYGMTPNRYRQQQFKGGKS